MRTHETEKTSLLKEDNSIAFSIFAFAVMVHGVAVILAAVVARYGYGREVSADFVGYGLGIVVLLAGASTAFYKLVIARE